jgi:demethylmenaquinone methyltransferase/2-methoxy-6-polyprenyl-1,4-benzoquinol methylase
MLKVASRRLARSGLVDRVSLFCADALQIPLANQEFDVVFCSFTLELFDTPEIPSVLAEIKRVLKTGGKLGIVCISNEGGHHSMMKIYHCLHNKFPQIVDCRPIYPAHSLEIAGFIIKSNLKGNLFGLPVEIVIGEK